MPRSIPQCAIVQLVREAAKWAAFVQRVDFAAPACVRGIKDFALSPGSLGLLARERERESCARGVILRRAAWSYVGVGLIRAEFYSGLGASGILL